MEGGELFHQIVKLTYSSENLARHVIVQVAQGIRYLHEERGVVHRDIKPGNFVMAKSDKDSPYLVNIIDFGLAKKYRDPRSGAHIPYAQEDQHGVGTCLFASINTHLGVGESARSFS